MPAPAAPHPAPPRPSCPLPALIVHRTLGGLTLHEFLSARRPPTHSPVSGTPARLCDSPHPVYSFSPAPLVSLLFLQHTLLCLTSVHLPLQCPLPGVPFSSSSGVAPWPLSNVLFSERPPLTIVVKGSPSPFLFFSTSWDPFPMLLYGSLSSPLRGEVCSLPLEDQFQEEQVCICLRLCIPSTRLREGAQWVCE